MCRCISGGFQASWGSATVLCAVNDLANATATFFSFFGVRISLWFDEENVVCFRQSTTSLLRLGEFPYHGQNLVDFGPGFRFEKVAKTSSVLHKIGGLIEVFFRSSNLTFV